jgi:hypothetical protein
LPPWGVSIPPPRQDFWSAADAAERVRARSQAGSARVPPLGVPGAVTNPPRLEERYRRPNPSPNPHPHPTQTLPKPILTHLYTRPEGPMGEKGGDWHGCPPAPMLRSQSQAPSCVCSRQHPLEPLTHPPSTTSLDGAPPPNRLRELKVSQWLSLTPLWISTRILTLIPNLSIPFRAPIHVGTQS